MTLSGLKLYLLEEMMAELLEPGTAPLLTGVTVGVAPPSPPPGPWAGHGVTAPGTRDESDSELRTNIVFWCFASQRQKLSYKAERC